MEVTQPGSDSGRLEDASTPAMGIDAAAVSTDEQPLFRAPIRRWQLGQNKLWYRNIATFARFGWTNDGTLRVVADGAPHPDS